MQYIKSKKLITERLLKMITIKQLQNFLVLSKELHFAKAADKLGMSQAALSKEIQKLEQKIGCELFDRSNKWDIKLTEAGETYLAEISEIPNLLNIAKERAVRAKRGHFGHLSIGITGIAYNYINLGNIFKSVKTAYPEITLRITEQFIPQETLNQLTNGKLDLAIIPIADFSTLPQNCKYKVIAEFQLRYVLPNTPHWQQKNEISIQDVINCNFILPSYSSSQMFRPKFELFCLDKCNKKPTISHEIDGLESTYQLIAAGLGISILPEINIAKSNYNIIFRSCDFNIKCYTVAVWDENNHSKALKNLITLL